MRVEVLRAFYWEGEVQPVGSALEVSERQAAELVAMGKARRGKDSPAPAPSGPLTTDTAGAIVSGKKGRKE